MKHSKLPKIKLSAKQHEAVKEEEVKAGERFVFVRPAFTLVSFSVSGYSACWHVLLEHCDSLYPLHMYGCLC